jgi:surface protein
MRYSIRTNSVSRRFSILKFCFIAALTMVSTNVNAQFILEIAVPANKLQMQLPLRGNTNVTVDWGDGTITNHSANYPQSPTNSISHTYSSPGTYTISISGTTVQFGDNSISPSTYNTYMPKLTKVLLFGDLGITSFESAFKGAVNLTQVPSLLPSSVTDMSGMFYGATSFNQDLSTWDVSKVTNMSNTFNRATSFNPIYLDCVLGYKYE